MRWWFLLALPAGAWAQLTISTVDAAGMETRVDLTNAAVDLGIAQAGDTIDTRFRLRNTGTALISLGVLQLNGVGFTLINTPPIPDPMAPGTNVDFRVRFQPQGPGSFSAVLQANEKSVIVRAQSPAGAALYWEMSPPNLTLVTNLNPLDFGRTEFGASVERRFVFKNEGVSPVTVNRLLLSGDSFAFDGAPGMPLTLAPGATAPFGIRFSGIHAGIPQGAFQVDNRQFVLAGSVSDPPLPTAQIIFPGGPPRSGQQARIVIQLASPVQTPGTATLTMEFLSSVNGVNDDAAIQFVPESTRSVTLRYAVGDTALRWTNGTQGVFQTGTTTGTIVFRLSFGPQTPQASVILAPEPAQFEAASLAQTLNGVEIQTSGFDNSRTASKATFTFRDRSGNPVPGGMISADVSAPFSQYFNSSALGGMFLLRARFPVTGNASQIGGVTMELVNAAGSGTADATAPN